MTPARIPIPELVHVQYHPQHFSWFSLAHTLNKVNSVCDVSHTVHARGPQCGSAGGQLVLLGSLPKKWHSEPLCPQHIPQRCEERKEVFTITKSTFLFLMFSQFLKDQALLTSQHPLALPQGWSDSKHSSSLFSHFASSLPPGLLPGILSSSHSLQLSQPYAQTQP